MFKLSELFKEDYFRMTGIKYKSGIKAFYTLLYSHQIRYMYIWRKYKAKPVFIWKLQLYRYSRKYFLEISPKAEIGHGFYLGHPYGITVAGGVNIGNNCNLHKGCTIGMENRGKRKGVPSLGNCVSVGINSTIVGNIRIGNDVLIAGNSFVNFDVPDHSIVIGNPGVIYKKEDATKDYIRFMIEE